MHRLASSYQHYSGRTRLSAADDIVSLSYDTQNRPTSSAMGGTVYTDPAHLDAATLTGEGASYGYDAAGNMVCRNVNSPSTTCSGSPGGWTGNTIGYDTAGRMTSWANTPANPTSSEQMAYDSTTCSC